MNLWDSPGWPFAILFVGCFTYTVVDLIRRLGLWLDGREARRRWRTSEAITLQAHRAINAAACMCRGNMVGVWTCSACRVGQHRDCKDGMHGDHCLCAHYGHER